MDTRIEREGSEQQPANEEVVRVMEEMVSGIQRMADATTNVTQLNKCQLAQMKY